MNTKIFLIGMATALSCAGFADSAPSQKKKTAPPPTTGTCCPSFWPKVENEIGLSLAADFLYWQASQTGMSYGQVANFLADIYKPPSDTTSYYASNRNVEFQFDPGVRASFGFRPRHDDWGIDFIWTHLNTSASGFSDLPGQFRSFVVVPAFSVPQTNANNSTNIRANWWAWYNTIDLDMHRGLIFRNYFEVKAHLGLKNLWLNQKYNLLAINTYDNNVPPVIIYNATGKMRQNIWGIGPMFGLDTLWNVYRGFSLFGKAMFSLIWSNIHSSNLGQSYYSNPATVTVKMLASFHTVLPETILSIGGQYDMNFCQDKYHLKFLLGWELTTLFNANFLGGSYSSLGDFNMSGLTTGLRLDF
jgi:hypothetical protein